MSTYEYIVSFKIKELHRRNRLFIVDKKPNFEIIIKSCLPTIRLQLTLVN